MGIKLWQRAGHHFGIITARSSHIVKIRAAELGIETVRQGASDKLPAAIKIIEDHRLNAENICYVGDDLSDIRLLAHVGLAVTVADGVEEVRAVTHHTTKAAGGQGAIRELIEMILKSQQRWDELLRKYQPD